MTEEYASMKQIEFMKKLGFPPQSADLLKSDARRMIDAKLNEPNGKVDDAWKDEKAPVERIAPGAVTPKPANGAKEYHLSPEEVKCRALECAIEMLKYFPETNIEEKADKFVEWINQSS